MEEPLLVSIIIDNYNYEPFLEEAIESALTQTYSNVEVIVVDDGSTDNSVGIINKYTHRVKAILKDNGGQASAFNAGFKASKGEVVIFLDSDDTLFPTAAEKAVELFDREQVAKVHWPLLRIDAEGNKTGEEIPDKELAEGDLKAQVISLGPAHCGGPPNSPPTSGNAWLRRYLEEIFPMPEEEFRQTADFYLMVLAPVFGTIKALGEPQGLYRVHGKNSTLRQEYLERYLVRFEHCCNGLSAYLKKKGIDVNASSWPRDHWFHLVHRALRDIKDVVPPASSFILVDGTDLGTGDILAGRRRHQFMEHNGRYWGPPANDEEAIEEIERQRRNGASSILFAWPAFWMLDHYKVMEEHLQKNYTNILNNHLLVGFDLQNNKNRVHH